MYDLIANAFLNNDTIEVNISGNLANSCYEASIQEQDVEKIKSSKTAKIFISERIKPGSQVCLMMLVPWSAKVSIPNTQYNKVIILINNQEKLQIDVCKKQKSQ